MRESRKEHYKREKWKTDTKPQGSNASSHENTKKKKKNKPVCVIN